MISAHLDQISPVHMDGWAFNTEGESKGTVNLCLHGDVFATGSANHHRSDLERRGILDGNVAFKFTFPSCLTKEMLAHLSFRYDDAPFTFSNQRSALARLEDYFDPKFPPTFSVETLQRSHRVVAFTSNGLYKDFFGAAPTLLQDLATDYQVVNLFDRFQGHPLDSAKSTFYFPFHLLNDLNWDEGQRHCFVTSNQPRWLLPQQAKVINIHHESFDCATDIAYDFHFVTTSIMMKSVTTFLQRMAEVTPKQGRRVGIIPVGNAEIDLTFLRDIPSRPATLTTTNVLLAPTIHAVDSVFPGYLFPTKIIETITSIRKAIADATIWLRLHPVTRKRHPDIVAQLEEKISRQTNVVFDDGAKPLVEAFSHSHLMITDFSGLAYSYALSQCKPVIFLSPNNWEVRDIRLTGKLKYDEYICHAEYAAHMSDVGLITADINNLPSYLRFLVEVYDDFQTGIAKFRETILFNLGESERAIASAIDLIARDREPEGVYVDL